MTVLDADLMFTGRSSAGPSWKRWAASSVPSRRMRSDRSLGKASALATAAAINVGSSPRVAVAAAGVPGAVALGSDALAAGSGAQLASTSINAATHTVRRVMA